MKGITMSDKENGKHLFKDVIYALCKYDEVSGDVYKSVLLSITMLGDDRVTDEQKAKINFELSLFIAEMLSANDIAQKELTRKGVVS